MTSRPIEEIFERLVKDYFKLLERDKGSGAEELK
jgi:hypothetical protein